MTKLPTSAEIDTQSRASRTASQREIVAREDGFSFTRGELDAAFDAVSPAGNWKLPIDASFQTTHIASASRRRVAAVRQAIIFFTGSVPEIKHTGNFVFRVTAAGYYAAVGA